MSVNVVYGGQCTLCCMASDAPAHKGCAGPSIAEARTTRFLLYAKSALGLTSFCCRRNTTGVSSLQDDSSAEIARASPKVTTAAVLQKQASSTMANRTTVLL
jgi:hypothetical protein